MLGEDHDVRQVDDPIPMGNALKLTFSSKSFLILVAANFMSILMQALLLGSIFYLADYVLQVGNVMVVLAALLVTRPLEPARALKLSLRPLKSKVPPVRVTLPLV